MTPSANAGRKEDIYCFDSIYLEATRDSMCLLNNLKLFISEIITIFENLKNLYISIVFTLQHVPILEIYLCSFFDLLNF